MPDELSERELAGLFTELRADVMPLVQAPGVAAARQTVRRRRTATTTALVVTLVAALGVGMFLRPTLDQMTAAGPLSEAELTELAGTAIGVVDTHLAGMTGTRTVAAGDQRSVGAYRSQEPVEGGYRKVWPAYRGDLTLVAACAGSGIVSLRVFGLASRDAGRMTDTRLAQTTLTCSDQGPAQVAGFVAHPSREIAVEVVDAGTDTAGASIGYRIVTDADEAVLYGDKAAEPASVIGDVPSAKTVTLHRAATSEREWSPIGAVNTFRIACSGNGSVKVDMRFSTGTRDFAKSMTDRSNTYDVLCRARPVEYQYVVGSPQATTAGIALTFQGKGVAPAEVAYGFVQQ